MVKKVITATRFVGLGDIERKASWVRMDAEDLARYVRLVVSLPDFDTEAEDSVSNAETALTEALLAVKISKLELERKRKIPELEPAE